MNTALTSILLLAVLIVKVTNQNLAQKTGLSFSTITQMKNEIKLRYLQFLMTQQNATLLPSNDVIESDEYHKLMISLKNETLRVTVKNMSPFVIFKKQSGNVSNEQIKLTGFVGDLWNILEEHLGFKTEIIQEESQPNIEDWDIKLNPKEWIVAKVSKYDYTLPISKIWYNVYFKEMTAGASSFYLEILHKKLWNVILVEIFLLSLFLWIVWKIRKAYWIPYDVNFRVKTDTNYMTCFLSVLGCMTNQGTQFKSEKSCSVRIITLVCILFGLIITTSFSALLISKLATSGQPTTVTTLRKLAKTGSRTLCVAKSSYAYKRLVAGSPEYVTNSKLILNGAACTQGKHDFVPSQDYCTDNTAVLETLYNVINAMQINPVLNRESCRVYINYEKHYQSLLILLVRKGFPYLKIINQHLLLLEETGLMKKISETWKPTKFSGFDISHYNPAVRFDHIERVVYLYGVTIGISLLIFTAEVIHTWIKRT